MTEKKAVFFDPKSNLKSLLRIVALIAIVVFAVWLFIRFAAGPKAAHNFASNVLKKPVELKNSIENLPATSMKGFALSLPYTGTLTVEATVTKGNEVNVYLVQPDQMDNVKNNKKFTYFEGFDAQKTKSYRRSGRLNQGNYYFVVIDTSLGILSASATDIQINAKLEP
jgi:hypothetical protein